MKDKLLQIRVDDVFLSKLEYLKSINGFKTVAETIRKIIEKEYRKETDNEELIDRKTAENAIYERIKQIGYENDPLVLSIRQAIRDVPSINYCAHTGPE